MIPPLQIDGRLDISITYAGVKFCTSLKCAVYYNEVQLDYNTLPLARGVTPVIPHCRSFFRYTKENLLVEKIKIRRDEDQAIASTPCYADFVPALWLRYVENVASIINSALVE